MHAAIVFAVFFFAFPQSASASLLGRFFKFFSNAEATYAAPEENMASLSFPLLGSQNATPAGVGGPEHAEGEISLAATQDSALIASRNPIGTILNPYQDRILVYTVGPGDVPSVIAQRFGISLNTLLWANNIRNPNLIKVGDELIILPVTGIQYTVKRGDTFSTIAKKFGGSVNDIIHFNGFAVGELLHTGQSIIIPNGEITTPRVRQTPSSVSRLASLPSYSNYFIRPINGGRKSFGIHGYNAVDLANSCGLPVYASASGQVIVGRSSGWNGGYGQYLVLTHPNNTQTLYAHLSALSTSVGQWVTQGSVIGLIGSTGNSTGCHVHFEIRGARNPF